MPTSFSTLRVSFGRVRLVADAVRRLGPLWACFRVRYAIEQRAGLLERRSPITDWPQHSGDASIPNIVDTPTLRTWLRDHVTEQRRRQLDNRVDALRNRTFPVFGQDRPLSSWHTDPITNARYDGHGHWSQVNERGDADLKSVWEPSRFGWTFDLVRAQLVDDRSDAADVFWELLDDWMRHNPPNVGVNWWCGQEASLRLMAVVASASAFEHHSTAEQREMVRQLAHVTADRVAANIDYARSQQNNHHASEAVGLLTAALAFPQLEQSHAWRTLGERHLREVCERLVFADGGTSQYSTNYHRVFVQNLVWAHQLYRCAGADQPRWLLTALERASDLMIRLVDPTSGDAPFFGSDDGARILPLSDAPHRHLVDDAVAAAAASRNRAGTMPKGEPSAWFGLDDDGLAPAVPDQPRVSSFPDFGVHVAQVGAVYVSVRASDFRFRPSHDDQLHCDIWIDGVNLAPDSGTSTYKRTATSAPLDLAEYHNGPRAGDSGSMRRASRFLWARWTSAVLVDASIGDGEVCLGFELQGNGQTVHRRVSVTADSVTVDDAADVTTTLQVNWLLPHLDGSRFEHETTAPHRRVDRPVSAGYSQQSTEPGWLVSDSVAPNHPIRFSVRSSPDA